jgi:hypothetical protein
LNPIWVASFQIDLKWNRLAWIWLRFSKIYRRGVTLLMLVVTGSSCRQLCPPRKMALMVTNPSRVKMGLRISSAWMSTWIWIWTCAWGQKARITQPQVQSYARERRPIWISREHLTVMPKLQISTATRSSRSISRVTILCPNTGLIWSRCQISTLRKKQRFHMNRESHRQALVVRDRTWSRLKKRRSVKPTTFRIVTRTSVISNSFRPRISETGRWSSPRTVMKTRNLAHLTSLRVWGAMKLRVKIQGFLPSTRHCKVWGTPSNKHLKRCKTPRDKGTQGCQRQLPVRCKRLNNQAQPLEDNRLTGSSWTIALRRSRWMVATTKPRLTLLRQPTPPSGLVQGDTWRTTCWQGLRGRFKHQRYQAMPRGDTLVAREHQGRWRTISVHRRLLWALEIQSVLVAHSWTLVVSMRRTRHRHPMTVSISNLRSTSRHCSNLRKFSTSLTYQSHSDERAWYTRRILERGFFNLDHDPVALIDWF